MSDVFETDTCVIGAGVVGLAVARALSCESADLVIVEAATGFGEGISSRNSEVIHAGIYYPRGSLKAELCVRGKTLLYEYCESAGISHRRIGKLIVATNPDEVEQLEAIRQRAHANGVDDLEFVDAARLLVMEPQVSATQALWSPSTGIVSAHELMTSLLGNVEGQGGYLASRAVVTGVEINSSGFLVRCTVEEQDYRFQCRRLVNAAGLGAQGVAAAIDGLPPALVPPLFFCKGNYFVYEGRAPFSHLIYPVPEAGGAGLGVHATIDLGGQVRFGPDVEHVQDEHYEVSHERVQAGIRAISRYFPGLDPAKLKPGYAGIRPKLVPEGQPAADFVIQGPELHGIEGLVNLYGIESPGLTASLAIAERVADCLQGSS